MVLLLNKPRYWTSFDVVKKLRTLLHTKKVGHAGTLDPLATGLLLVCTDAATRSISSYQDLPKVYTGEMVLGKTTPSIDLETSFDSETPYEHLTPTSIHSLVSSFTGTIKQIPPKYSAIKVCGERSYKKARRGQEVMLLPREVHIYAFFIHKIELPSIHFEVSCSKGTYIRSLVRDFGEQLGVGAYLHTLCRTRIGDFKLEDAHDIRSITERLPEAPYPAKKRQSASTSSQADVLSPVPEVTSSALFTVLR